MSTFTKRCLSGSTNGRGIKVVETATAGTLIHTAVSGTSDYDELYLYVYNSDSSTRQLTIEFGGVSAPDDNIKVGVASQSGLMLVIPGLVLQNGCEVRAFGSLANVLVIFGFVNRIVN